MPGGWPLLPTGPCWVSDNASGWSTLYSSTGTKTPLNVLIPTAGGDGPGTPTGIVFNGSQEFKMKGSPAIFMFAALDGTISGWAPSVNPNTAIIAIPSTGAVYTGLTISTEASVNFLFAADTVNNKVDIFDGNFTFVRSFSDATVPAGFSVYGIQDFGGLIYVSFASTSNGTGGYIDIFDENGAFLKRLTRADHCTSHGVSPSRPIIWGRSATPCLFRTTATAARPAGSTR
jgi:uncharacterized protein (TIGR03118 family)